MTGGTWTVQFLIFSRGGSSALSSRSAAGGSSHLHMQQSPPQPRPPHPQALGSVARCLRRHTGTTPSVCLHTGWCFQPGGSHSRTNVARPFPATALSLRLEEEHIRMVVTWKAHMLVVGGYSRSTLDVTVHRLGPGQMCWLSRCSVLQTLMSLFL